MPHGRPPGWIVNVTNDGWFGNSDLALISISQQSRVQAIEEGLPLVRAANTGISAVVDPLGRMVNLLPLGREGVLNSTLPRPIAARSTPASAMPPPSGLWRSRCLLLFVAD